MPDVNTSLVDNAANQLESKLSLLFATNLHKGLNALNHELMDGKSKMSVSAKVLIDS